MLLKPSTSGLHALECLHFSTLFVWPSWRQRSSKACQSFWQLLSDKAVVGVWLGHVFLKQVCQILTMPVRYFCANITRRDTETEKEHSAYRHKPEKSEITAPFTGHMPQKLLRLFNIFHWVNVTQYYLLYKPNGYLNSCAETQEPWNPHMFVNIFTWMKKMPDIYTKRGWKKDTEVCTKLVIFESMMLKVHKLEHEKE